MAALRLSREAMKATQSERMVRQRLVGDSRIRFSRGHPILPKDRKFLL